MMVSKCRDGERFWTWVNRPYMEGRDDPDAQHWQVPVSCGHIALVKTVDAPKYDDMLWCPAHKPFGPASSRRHAAGAASRQGWSGKDCLDHVLTRISLGQQSLPRSKSWAVHTLKIFSQLVRGQTPHIMGKVAQLRSWERCLHAQSELENREDGLYHLATAQDLVLQLAHEFLHIGPDSREERLAKIPGFCLPVGPDIAGQPR
jgi:hypothetical protein